MGVCVVPNCPCPGRRPLLPGWLLSRFPPRFFTHTSLLPDSGTGTPKTSIPFLSWRELLTRSEVFSGLLSVSYQGSKQPEYAAMFRIQDTILKSSFFPCEPDGGAWTNRGHCRYSWGHGLSGSKCWQESCVFHVQTAATCPETFCLLYGQDSSVLRKTVGTEEGRPCPLADKNAP